MATSDILNCTCTDLHDRERVRYFSRQLMTADDMKAEQEYFRQKLRRHNRYLHGWGVVCGCEVKAFPDVNHPWRVRVCPGYIITPQGDEILIGDNVDFDLAGNWIQDEDPCAHPSPCSPPGIGLPAGENETVYLAACYSECNTHPVRVQPAGCGCDETVCEYSRIRDSFKLVRLAELPQSHLATQKDTDWSNKVEAWLDGGADDTWPVPDCPACPEDPCVVLATVTLPGARNTQITDTNIKYLDRRVLYSAQITQQWFLGQSSTVCVDFEPPLVVGTQYGTPVGNNSGDVVFTTKGIPVSVYDFNFASGGGTFNVARIESAPASFGSGQIIRTNNINLEFDFSQLNFQSSKVQFEFLDLGGFENISVNGIPVPVFAGELSAAPNPIGGVSIAVSTVPVSGGKKGVVTLTGVVKTLRIGGQEFWIDNVCVKK